MEPNKELIDDNLTFYNGDISKLEEAQNMTVKDIINLLPKERPRRLKINNMWEELLLKDDCAYNRVIQEYGDYIVIGIEAWNKGIYDYATLWLKVEEPTEDNTYVILDYALFEESEFSYLETYKNYTILKASLNQHNSEYVIKELGFNTRWASLTYCKKYIKERLNKLILNNDSKGSN